MIGTVLILTKAPWDRYLDSPILHEEASTEVNMPKATLSIGGKAEIRSVHCQGPSLYPPFPAAYIVPATLQGPFFPGHRLSSTEMAVVGKVMPHLLEKVSVRLLA